ncbi:MAG: TatD family hydrolase [Parcubacteria group bacterium GW2011_GWA1_50_14]|uniref:Hydrolase TatD n=1 Tax=Candidatus Liptonbacteria bacterium GWB1_49_6 TaxID=1798644 RepID=A0A1G2C7X0_9BACT|nr:MAG: TatD family hydrolase [Parcubacteria group bacterium GW2011_GWA1_50_14]OGY96597.1 MAG: hypothetical protein A2122_02685 [Candidatus Liptonbacteria bacterium GWB1_49_6]
MFFDAHTHAHFAAFENDWKEVIGRALARNVWLVNVGTQRDTSRRAIEVANEYKEGVYATVGLHPIHTEKSYHDVKELGTGDKAQEFTSRGEEFNYDTYKKLTEDPKVVAIGECGLDYYRLGEETKKRQAEMFIKQIELAHEVKKPLMIHCRNSPSPSRGGNAFDDLISLLSTHYSLLPNPPGIVHFFSGTPDDAKKILDMGFSFTFGGVITFTRDYDETIKIIPMDRILSETDAPYVSPVPYRGKRNEPAYVIEVVKKLAELKNIEVEEMEDQIFKNAKNIFRI